MFLIEIMNNLLTSLKNNPTRAIFQKNQGKISTEDTLGIALLVASNYLESQKKYTVVTTNLYNAQKIYDYLALFLGPKKIAIFPVDELIKTESIASGKEMMAQRLFTMHQLSRQKADILIVSLAGAMRYVPSVEVFQNNCFTLKVGSNISLDHLKVTLARSGYTRVNKIDQSLQFASRGDILDIFSINYDQPIRIEFFGDEIESIRYFEIGTQTSTQELESVEILPASDLYFSDEQLENLKFKSKTLLKQAESELPRETFSNLIENTHQDFENLEKHNYSQNLYKYLGFASKTHYSILDYMAEDSLILTNDYLMNKNLELINEQAFNYLKELYSVGKNISHLSLYQDFNHILLRKKKIIRNSELLASNQEEIFMVRPSIISGATIETSWKYIEEYLVQDYKVILALAISSQVMKVEEFFQSQMIAYEMVENLTLPKGKLGVALLNIEAGFELPQEKILYISGNELFGQKVQASKYLSRYKEATILRTYDELEPGDYVVHETYGIGRFLGIITMENDGIHRDYLHIAYKGSDALYVPLAQFKLVRKFSGKEGATPRMHSLKGKEWENTKRRIKERVNELADRLIALYQERSKQKGFQFAPDDELQAQFENNFAYHLTKDQEIALQEIKDDMEIERPMDRLLCGDVGFGKTEVAFRAAFKAMLNGKQVAILCPTTLLARQHYEVALERFKGFGIKIAQLSRLVPAARQKDYIQGIKDGTVHLTIGTHRLLSKEVKFKDLGFLVVDEEQRFGVEQKEKIKELKTNIDVLTLSATPIPRTLQMSLVGIRSLSRLNTPPDNRMAIQTYVITYDQDIIKELIERELGRRGQVFYLHNNVLTIENKAKKITTLVKGSKVGIVHGQMDKDVIEDVMLKFYAGELNVLVATSIIENGIDIPNANLIIIENAANFGLSQLYQIKGRVGRSNRLAFAYLLVHPQKEMSEIASKRLKAIQDFTELGSGYKIAQRDLMIRGAGDILGPEQAGFIDSVGIDMYLKLLNEVIEEKRTGKIAPPPSETVSLAIDTYIPEKFAGQENKYELYHEINKTKNKDELLEVSQYIQDLYGKIPLEVKTVIQKRAIDILLENPAFESVKESKTEIDIKLSGAFLAISKAGTILFDQVSDLLALIKVHYFNRQLVITLTKSTHWLDDFENLLNKIAHIYTEYHRV